MHLQRYGFDLKRNVACISRFNTFLYYLFKDSVIFIINERRRVNGIFFYGIKF